MCRLSRHRALGYRRQHSDISKLVGDAAEKFAMVGYARAAQLDAQANLQDARNAGTSIMLSGMFPYLIVFLIALVAIVALALLLKSKEPAGYNMQGQLPASPRTWVVENGHGERVRIVASDEAPADIRQVAANLYRRDLDQH